MQEAATGDPAPLVESQWNELNADEKRKYISNLKEAKDAIHCSLNQECKEKGDELLSIRQRRDLFRYVFAAAIFLGVALNATSLVYDNKLWSLSATIMAGAVASLGLLNSYFSWERQTRIELSIYNKLVSSISSLEYGWLQLGDEYSIRYLSYKNRFDLVKRYGTHLSSVLEMDVEAQPNEVSGRESVSNTGMPMPG